jgi:hypothetical protein
MTPEQKRARELYDSSHTEDLGRFVSGTITSTGEQINIPEYTMSRLGVYKEPVSINTAHAKERVLGEGFQRGKHLDYDSDEDLAQNISGWEKAGKGVTKFIGKTAIHTVGNIVGLGAGLMEAAIE